MPYQVLGDSSAAVEVTMACTRSARARSSGAIAAMLSRAAWSASAFLAPFLPSARSSAARSFMAARSSALNPSGPVVLVAGMVVAGSGSARGRVAVAAAGAQVTDVEHGGEGDPRPVPAGDAPAGRPQEDVHQRGERQEDDAEERPDERREDGVD